MSPKKILAAYHTQGGHPNSCYEGYIHGLRQLGHDVDWINSWSLWQAPQTGYDLLIQFDCCDDYAPPVNLKYPNVYWAYDNWQNPTNNRQFDYEPDGQFSRQGYYIGRAKMANWVFSMSAIGCKNYAQNGIKSYYLPIGADERLLVSDNEHHQKDYIVACISTYWHMAHQNNRRGELADFLQKQFPNKHFITSGAVYYEQTRLYARSKIVWNYSPCGFDVLNFRVWEALISGTPFLTNDIIKNQIEALGYQDRLNFYKDDESDLMRAVNEILENYQSAFIKAHDAKLFTLTKHTMRHRMEEMLQIVGMK